ncbi:MULTISPECIES: acyl-CoA dehydrogenase family protein [Acinetobacter]|uniref:Acyl-CoA dehydrogenase family protein n=1 Tax=Acinetobacter indicus TaxID=756892 RepID=A0AAW8YY97_9GAMM|nr:MULTISPECIES: acyl-CoA dehydrogenase family protein [Acinetobacter]MCO8100409.1 acyl-CoA dehydrogenase family protein [Acinetobacter indicus]MCO8103268.1 acyl-CoA dehydrogenase family protein [Acinetobacter indicus]MCO8105871.1 acyl-CoA dehydrogenase family protein [Acinetobacter indicus]MCO8111545.1 acyl-CoA dehydrogenase family protein [Acinetobacter indicus]MDM1244012.1 acyl-CoA dehydrogenase family protein [Acinetobacter indicus]
MNLQNPKKFKLLIDQAHEVALNVLRPISRKYDKAEHAYPKELDMLASVVDGMNAGGDGMNAGAAVNKRGDTASGNKNGVNMSTALSIVEMCYGDTGLLLSMPRQGLGNSAIAAVANDEQLQRFHGTWAAMAITEPGCGSDSAAIRTTAVADGDDYILNGEKIFVTSGERADAVVVWATLDKKLGRAAIKSFVVPKGTPGMTVERLEHKLGIKASDTAAISFVDCRVPASNLLGNAEIDVSKGFAGVMETFDNTRPLVAAMAIGCAKASLERIKQIFKHELDEHYQTAYLHSSQIAAQIYRMEAEWEAARLLMLKAAWMADNKQPNSKEASIAKAKAGRVGNEITLKCVELAAAVGYNEDELLEKWARDSKILDIFEGTQQIQQLIIARRELGKNSSELK